MLSWTVWSVSSTLLDWSRLMVTGWATRGLRGGDSNCDIQHKVDHTLIMHTVLERPLSVTLGLGICTPTHLHPNWTETQSVLAILLESFRRMLYQFSATEPFLERFCSWGLNIFRSTQRHCRDPLVARKPTHTQVALMIPFHRGVWETILCLL